TADEDDRRWDLLEGAEDEAEDDWEDDEEVYEDDWQPRRRRVARRPSRRRGKPSQQELRDYLEGLPAAELGAYLMQLVQRYPDVASELADRRAVARSDVGELIRKARKEITRLTSEDAWYNHWTGEGNLPDYGGLKDRLEKLLDMGQADALLELGEELFEKGVAQIESSHDEGETASEISQCLGVICRAVPLSSRSDRDKLLFFIDLLLRDDYDLVQDVDAVLERDWPRQVWSEVADELARRLKGWRGSGDEFSRQYVRGRLTNWLIHALENAGRQDEVLPLCEAEARTNGDYE